MSLRQKAAKGIWWSAVGSAGSTVTMTIVFLALARLLSPADFGIVALASVFVSLLAVLVQHGFSEAIVQREDLDDEHVDTALWCGVLIGMGLALVAWIAAGVIASLLSEPQLAPVLRVLALVFIVAGFSSTPTALLRRKLAFRSLTYRTLSGNVVGGVVGVAMAFFGFGVWSLVARTLVADVVACLVLWVVCPHRPRFRISLDRSRELLQFGVSVTGTHLLYFLNRRSDDFLIGAFLGPVALGYYAVGYRLLGMVQELFVNTIGAVALPAFSRLQGDRARLRHAFYSATQLTSAVALPAFVGVALVAPELVDGVFGPQWEPSIPVMQVLAIAGIALVASRYTGSLLLATGKPQWHLGLVAVNSLAGLAFFAIAVPWGIVAVASALVIRSFLLMPLQLWAARRVADIDMGPYLRQFVAPLGATASMALGVLALRWLLPLEDTPLLFLVLAIPWAATVYGCSLRLLAPALVHRIIRDTRSLRTPRRAADHAKGGAPRQKSHSAAPAEE